MIQQFFPRCMRKLEQSDKEFIQKLRANLRSQYELSLDPPACDSTCDQSFYDQFNNEILKHSRIKSIKIRDSSQVPKSIANKEHTIYQLEISTNQLTYTIHRRFRQFYTLYKKIKTQLPKCLDFPKKNYNPFVSSISPTIIQERTNKLNLFMKEVLQYVMAHKDPLITLRLFSFIELKQTYENRQLIISRYRKSSSEKGHQNRYYIFKGHFSEKKLNNFSENSLEMYIALINQPSNPGKHLPKLEQIIKNKKTKATNQEIKLIFMGFDSYYGVLKFGLTNSLQTNRIAALQILVDLLLPQRNLSYEKYQKIVQKLPLQLWIVEDISYLDSTVFKVLYFTLLSIYCEKTQKDQYKGEKLILKSLFLFHQNLMNDYFQWKKVNYRQHQFPHFDSSIISQRISVDWCQKIDISQFKDDHNIIESLECPHNNIKIYYYQPKNTLILTLTTTKKLNEISSKVFKWNRFFQSFTVQQYTGLYRYSMRNNEKKWNIRLKVQSFINSDDKITFESKSALLPYEIQNSIHSIITNSHFKMSKQQSPFQFYPQYQQEIWVQTTTTTNQMAIILKTSRSTDIFDRSLRPQALKFAQDAIQNFA